MTWFFARCRRWLALWRVRGGSEDRWLVCECGGSVSWQYDTPTACPGCRASHLVVATDLEADRQSTVTDFAHVRVRP